MDQLKLQLNPTMSISDIVAINPRMTQSQGVDNKNNPTSAGVRFNWLLSHAFKHLKS